MQFGQCIGLNSTATNSTLNVTQAAANLQSGLGLGSTVTVNIACSSVFSTLTAVFFMVLAFLF